MLEFLLMLVAIICLLLAALNWNAPRGVSLLALGLMFWAICWAIPFFRAVHLPA